MNNKLYIFISAFVGVISGFVTIHSPLAHSWTSAIFWVIVGFIVIYFSSNRRSAMIATAVFAFLDIASWLLSGFQGTTAQLPGIFSIILIAGSLCSGLAVLGAVLFYRIFRRTR
jgi:uncharacterized membrane protein